MSTCDFCTEPATWDTKTIMGPWANTCDRHYAEYGTAPSTNLADAEAKRNRSDDDRRADLYAALDTGDLDAAMDAIGDGDIFEYL